MSKKLETLIYSVLFYLYDDTLKKDYTYNYFNDTTYFK